MTKAFREAQMKEKLERYPKVNNDFLKFLWGGLAPASDCDISTGSQVTGSPQHHHVGPSPWLSRYRGRPVY